MLRPVRRTSRVPRLPRQPRIRILPYRQGSQSASALATALGGRVLKIDGTGTFQPRQGDTVINWGNTTTEVRVANVLNSNYNIRNVSNKLSFFNLMRPNNNEIIPEFWTDRNSIPDTEFPIVCRTILAGHSGAGIVIANTREELVPASLYVKYIKKEQEYRVHGGLSEGVFRVISLQRKARNPSTENPNWQVRNHNNGFIFVRGGFTAPQSVLDVAESSLRASGLDFGGIDVIWNARQERAYVLEINTAVGLEGQTVEDYANYFRGII